MKNQTIEQAVEEFKAKQTLVEPDGFLADVGEDYEAVDFNMEVMEVWLREALQAQRDAGAREAITAQAELEMLKRVVEKVRELDKYDYIPVQVKEENPSAWAMYSEGRNKIFKDILASLEIINPKE